MTGEEILKAEKLGHSLFLRGFYTCFNCGYIFAISGDGRMVMCPPAILPENWDNSNWTDLEPCIDVIVREIIW